MTESFRVPIAIRGYELGVNGHLNWAHYRHYAGHARWEWGDGKTFRVRQEFTRPETPRWPPS